MGVDQSVSFRFICADFPLRYCLVKSDMSKLTFHQKAFFSVQSMLKKFFDFQASWIVKISLSNPSPTSPRTDLHTRQFVFFIYILRVIRPKQLYNIECMHLYEGLNVAGRRFLKVSRLLLSPLAFQ